MNKNMFFKAIMLLVVIQAGFVVQSYGMRGGKRPAPKRAANPPAKTARPGGAVRLNLVVQQVQPKATSTQTQSGTPTTNTSDTSPSVPADSKAAAKPSDNKITDPVNPSPVSPPAETAPKPKPNQLTVSTGNETNAQSLARPRTPTRRGSARGSSDQAGITAMNQAVAASANHRGRPGSPKRPGSPGRQAVTQPKTQEGALARYCLNLAVNNIFSTLGLDKSDDKSHEPFSLESIQECREMVLDQQEGLKLQQSEITKKKKDAQDILGHFDTYVKRHYPNAKPDNKYVVHITSSDETPAHDAADNKTELAPLLPRREAELVLQERLNKLNAQFAQSNANTKQEFGALQSELQSLIDGKVSHEDLIMYLSEELEKEREACHGACHDGCSLKLCCCLLCICFCGLADLPCESCFVKKESEAEEAERLRKIKLLRQIKQDIKTRKLWEDVRKAAKEKTQTTQATTAAVIIANDGADNKLASN